MGCCGIGRTGTGNIATGIALFGGNGVHPSWVNTRIQDPLPEWAQRNQAGYIKVKIGQVAGLDLTTPQLVVLPSIMDYLRTNSPDLFQPYPYPETPKTVLPDSETVNPPTPSEVAH
jgi:hypothetical protein